MTPWVKVVKGGFYHENRHYRLLANRQYLFGGPKAPGETFENGACRKPRKDRSHI